MAKVKRKSSARAGTVRQVAVTPSSLPSQFRIASAPPEAALGRTLAREVAKLDRNVLVTTARGLLSGQLTLQGVLSSLADAGSRAVDSATKASQHAAAQQELSSRQLRAELTRMKTDAPPPRPRKDDYVVRGQVMQVTGEPAVGLAVEAIDKDVYKHDLLGATITDSKGTFQIAFPKKIFAESGEKDPEIVLALGVEGRAPLHVTAPTRMAERELTLAVTLPGNANSETNPVSERVSEELEPRMLRVQQRQAVSALQSQHLGVVMKDAQAALAQLAAVLRPPSPAGSTTQPSRQRRRSSSKKVK